MKYFIVESNRDNNPSLQITDWFSQIDPRDICPERAGNIPQWFMLNVKLGDDTRYMDLISDPGFLISSKMYDVFQMYMPYLKYKKAVLFDPKLKSSTLYHLPIFNTYDCLLPESEWNRDKSKVISGIIDIEKTENSPIFRLGGVKNTQIAARLDLVESLLRRGVNGIRLTELRIK